MLAEVFCASALLWPGRSSSGAKPAAAQQFVLSPVTMNITPSAVISRSPALWPPPTPCGCWMSMIGTSEAGSSVFSSVSVNRATREMNEVCQSGRE